MTNLIGPRRSKEVELTRADRATRRLEKVVFVLGCIRIGLGVGEIVAPREIRRRIGGPRWPVLMRLKGLREISAGVGLLQHKGPAGTPTPVGTLGLAALLAAPIARRAARRRVRGAAIAVAGVTALTVILVRFKTPAIPATTAQEREFRAI